MDALSDIKEIVNSDDPRAAGVDLIIQNLKAVDAVLPEQAAFFSGVLFALYTNQGCPESAAEIFSACLSHDGHAWPN